MAYIFESKLPENKSVVLGLTYIYGIGKSTAIKLCKLTGFSLNYKIKHLTPKQLNEISQLIEELDLKVDVKLKKFRVDSAKKLLKIKSQRGLRKLKGLPVRGQRTHTNAKSARNQKYKK